MLPQFTAVVRETINFITEWRPILKLIEPYLFKTCECENGSSPPSRLCGICVSYSFETANESNTRHRKLI